MERNKDFSNIKVGDFIMIKGFCNVYHVTHITKTTFTLDERLVFYRKTGELKGGHHYKEAYIPADEDLRRGREQLDHFARMREIEAMLNKHKLSDLVQSDIIKLHSFLTEFFKNAITGENKCQK